MNKQNMLQIKKLQNDAIIPSRAHSGDLGYDLFSTNAVEIYPHTTEIINTGIAIKLPVGYGALIKDRSSIATKRGLFTVAGVIDNGYVGEIKIAFHNPTTTILSIYSHEKIAQLVLVPVADVKSLVVTGDLVSSDDRGTGGFGSTDT